MAERAYLPEPTHFGVYLSSAGPHHYHFNFHASTKKELEAVPERIVSASAPPARLVGCIRIPWWLRKEIGSWWSEAPPTRIGFKTYVGYILYRVKETARANPYAPKEGLQEGGERVARGLGYLLEEFCTRKLKERGFTHVQANPLSKRKGQLEKVGLPLETAVPIDGWIAGMRRGIKLRAAEWKRTRQ